MPEPWTAAWSNAVFSLEERDARWRKVRDLMRRDGIDLIVCLPCTNSHDRGQADARYLTQLGENSDETTVAFPVEGEVAAWHSRGGAWPSSNWQSVEIIKRDLPQARIVTATDLLGEVRYQKSDEEIEFLRKGTAVAERTSQVVREQARAGVPERHVFAHMMFANADAGGSFSPMFGWICGPFGNAYHRVEQPSFRKLAAGDVLSIEIEGRWGGYIAQIDETYSIGPAHQDLKDGMRLAWESFDRVLAALKPGMTVRELLAAGAVSGLNGRCQATLLMHGRGTGDDGPLVAGQLAPGIHDVELLEGCCMVVKPNVIVDGKPAYGHWGEVVVVRKNGAERLGTRPQELYELP
jgi:Xaa-Pro dipeptidase